MLIDLTDELAQAWREHDEQIQKIIEEAFSC